MQKIIYQLFITSCLYLSTSALAESTVKVEAFQAPAWKESARGTVALRAGMTLEKGERIKTGKAAKVVLGLSEGSQVKLGEESTFVLNALSTESEVNNTQQNDNVFTAAMQVLTGAFRFTTSRLGKANKRNIDIKLVTATVGIRGTDLWGRATAEQDFVCLLEGKIAISRGNKPEVTMNDPLSLYIAKRNQAAEALAKTSQEAVAELALETELDKGKGIITEQGQYVVYLLSSQDRNDALRVQNKFDQLGYASSILEANVKNGLWYRVAVKNFASLVDARYFADSAKQRLGINSAWVAKL